MSTNDAVVYKYTQLSASAQIPTAYFVGGVLCSSSSSGTLKIWDNSAASGAVLVDTMPLVAGQWYPIQAVLLTKTGFNGFFVTIGGTASITVFWN